MPEVCLFVGPSAHGLDLDALCDDDMRRLPPAGRGDVDHLIASEPSGVLLLCDGVFQARPAVSHAELCRALDAGWQVWGVSSIGAVRALELRGEGMQGFGVVYAMFEQMPDVSDDEVCVLHFPEPPYFPVTEALVNVRYAIGMLRERLKISNRSEHRLTRALRALWFGDRSEQRIAAVMRDDAGLSDATAEALLAWIRVNRAKTIDLAALLTQRPWAIQSRVSAS